MAHSPSAVESQPRPLWDSLRVLRSDVSRASSPPGIVHLMPLGFRTKAPKGYPTSVPLEYPQPGFPRVPPPGFPWSTPNQGSPEYPHQGSPRVPHQGSPGVLPNRVPLEYSPTGFPRVPPARALPENSNDGSSRGTPTHPPGFPGGFPRSKDTTLTFDPIAVITGITRVIAPSARITSARISGFIRSTTSPSGGGGSPAVFTRVGYKRELLFLLQGCRPPGAALNKQ